MAGAALSGCKACGSTSVRESPGAGLVGGNIAPSEAGWPSDLAAWPWAAGLGRRMSRVLAIDQQRRRLVVAQPQVVAGVGHDAPSGRFLSSRGNDGCSCRWDGNKRPWSASARCGRLPSSITFCTLPLPQVRSPMITARLWSCRQAETISLALARVVVHQHDHGKALEGAFLVGVPNTFWACCGPWC